MASFKFHARCIVRALRGFSCILRALQFEYVVAARREMFAVRAGIRKYGARALNWPQGQPALLRRNTHRLEKGLIMRPRRDVFALDYIGETVHAYRAALEASQRGESTLSPEQLQWAHDVLQEYVAVTVHLAPEIVMINEVLIVGDPEFQKRWPGKMNEVSRSGHSVLFVSRRIADLENVYTRATLGYEGRVIFNGRTRMAI